MAPQAIPGRSGRVNAEAGGHRLCRGWGAGEGRGLAFGEALEGLLDRIAGGGAGCRGEVRVLALIGRDAWLG